jgi:molybdopterin-binding protein
MWSVGYNAPNRAKAEDEMKLSARNQITGRVIDVRKGQTTAHVRIDTGNAVVITSSITNEAVDDLGPVHKLSKSTFDRVIYWVQPCLILYVVVVIDIEPIRERFSAVAPFLDERGRRLVAAAEAFAAGYAGSRRSR